MLRLGAELKSVVRFMFKGSVSVLKKRFKWKQQRDFLPGCCNKLLLCSLCLTCVRVVESSFFSLLSHTPLVVASSSVARYSRRWIHFQLRRR
jgi:hypothetical protein